MTKLGALRVDFVGDSKSLTAAAAKSKASLASVGNQMDLLNKKQVTGKATTIQYGNSLTRIGQKAGLAKGGLRNMTFQLQDIIVQMNMGTRMSTIMAQQLPQLGASFGGVGLIIFSVIGALAAVAPLFMSTSENSEFLEKSLGELTETTEAYLNAVSRSQVETSKMREEFGSMTGAAQQTLATLVQIAKFEALASLQSTVDELATSFEGFARITEENIRKFLGLSHTFFGFTDDSEEVTKALGDMDEALAQLAKADGPQQQADALGNIAQSIIDVKGGVENVNGELLEFVKQLLLAEQQAQILTDTIGGTADEIMRANEFMSAFGTTISRAAAEMSRLRDLAVAVSIGSGAVGAGRGGAPKGESAAVRVLGGEFITPDKKKSGAGKISPLERDLERLQKNLATEIEIEMEHFANQAEVLQQALDSRMISQQEFENLSERSKKQHLDRMQDLDKMSGRNQIRAVQGIFGNLTGLMQSQSKKLFAIGKAAAIANAIISTHRGITKALELPFPMNLAAAAAVAAKGFASVAAIQSQSIGGGGVGAGSASAAATPDVDEVGSSTFVNVDIQGEGAISRGAVRNLIGLINDEIEDGAVLRGITVN